MIETDDDLTFEILNQCSYPNLYVFSTCTSILEIEKFPFHDLQIIKIRLFIVVARAVIRIIFDGESHLEWSLKIGYS